MLQVLPRVWLVEAAQVRKGDVRSRLVVKVGLLCRSSPLSLSLVRLLLLCGRCPLGVANDLGLEELIPPGWARGVQEALLALQLAPLARDVVHLRTAQVGRSVAPVRPGHGFVGLGYARILPLLLLEP